MKPDGRVRLVSPFAFAVLAGVLPIVAATAAYLLNLRFGQQLDPRFACFPFTEGCVSISRAVRSGPGLHLFRALMLPVAVLMFLTWAGIGAWLKAQDLCRARRRRWVVGLGAVGAAFLVGVLRIIRRVGSKYLRAISSPDDHFSLLLLTVWFAFAFLSVPNDLSGGEWHLLTYFILTAFFLVYVPFSKISHYLYYPFTRYYVGKTLGHRGVFPLRRAAGSGR